jgi:hypothetical protein
MFTLRFRPAALARRFGTTALFATLGSPALAANLTFTIEQITPNGLNPQVSGSRVVWESTGGSDGGSDREIFLYDNGVIAQLTTNTVHDLNARVSAAGVLWERGTNTDAEVMFFDGVNTTQITTNSAREQAITMSNSRAAWVTGAGTGLDVVTWDFTGSPTNLTSGMAPPNTADTLPSVRGNNLVWVRGSTPNQSIQKFDGTTVTTIATSSLALGDPAVDGDYVAWEGFKGGTVNDREIYLHDGSSALQLTDNSHPDFDPQISGGKVTWWGGVFNNNQVYLWENGAVTQLSNSGLNQFPKIDDQYIVWQGWEGFGGGDLEIFLWDGTQVHQLTDNDVDDTMPMISGNHIVWQSGGGVWHATFVVPEPGSLTLAGIGFAATAAVAGVRRRRRER